MKEVQLFERALESIHTVSNVSVVAPSLEGQLVFVHGPLSVDEVGGAMIVGSVAQGSERSQVLSSDIRIWKHICVHCVGCTYVLCVPTCVHTFS